MLSPTAAKPTTRPSSSATQISWSTGTISVMKRAVLLLGVQLRQERQHGLERGDERLGDRVGVLRRGPSDHPRTLRAVPRDRNEPVRLTKIYTRGGDAGETSLGDGSRASKLDPRIRAYGIVDELNSQLGVALAGDLPERCAPPLERVQNELFDVGADLSVPFAGADERLRTTQAMIDGLEALCDEHNAALPELKSFVLPGGTEAAARLHVARTVARRAEHRSARGVDVNPLARVYLNRVSDLLFILARAANTLRGPRRAALAPGRLAERATSRLRDERSRRAARQHGADPDAPVRAARAGSRLIPTILTSGRSACSPASVYAGTVPRSTTTTAAAVR